MQLEAFLLDSWLNAHDGPPIEFNLGGSTGPRWSAAEVLDLEGGSRDRLLAEHMVYAPTAGAKPLRKAIADMLSVEAEHVLVVAGGSEALLHIFFLAAEPGANVIVPFPGFPPYAAIPRALGVEVRFYQLRPENAYRVDFDEVVRLADGRTQLLLVNSPHNPTGATLDDDEMRRLHDFAVDRGIQFVSDEVFHPIYHGRAGASAAALPGATVVGDMSKALSLAGLRLGWIMEHDPDRRARYENARQYFTISNTVIAELLAEIAIRHRETIWDRARTVAQSNLRHVEMLLANYKGVLECVRPTGGMTCFPRFIAGGDSRPFCEEAARRGVLLVPGDCFGMPNHFRLGFGVVRDGFVDAIRRIEALLAANAATA
jgi:aspartate/methionine/tyrosine aminotransferase